MIAYCVDLRLTNGTSSIFEEFKDIKELKNTKWIRFKPRKEYIEKLNLKITFQERIGIQIYESLCKLS